MTKLESWTIERHHYAYLELPLFPGQGKWPGWCLGVPTHNLTSRTQFQYLTDIKMVPLLTFPRSCNLTVQLSTLRWVMNILNIINWEKCFQLPRTMKRFSCLGAPTNDIYYYHLFIWRKICGLSWSHHHHMSGSFEIRILAVLCFVCDNHRVSGQCHQLNSQVPIS